METVLVAGATGYLGRYVVRALKARGFRVRALGRTSDKLAPVEEYADELYIGEVTDQASIDGACDDVDVVFSTVGITRQKDGLTYRDVDYQGNRNLLTAAEASGVARFVYVHVLNARKLRHVALVRAKQAFVDDLEKSGLEYSVVCPTGFFSDMEEFLAMAHSGRVYLIGDGSNRINPIHGADLAEVCVDVIEHPEREVDVGGPVEFTYREIAETAFEALGKPAKITAVPKPVVAACVNVLRWATPTRIFGPVQFLAAVMGRDMVAAAHGSRSLSGHFLDRAQRLSATGTAGESPARSFHRNR